jgi:hypothetical protein
MNLGFGQLFILICLAGLLFADLPAVVDRIKQTFQKLQNEVKPERTKKLSEKEKK